MSRTARLSSARPSPAPRMLEFGLPSGTRLRGAGMIEVLLAQLIFAVGLLGLGSVQMAARQYAFEAGQRSQATQLARDFIERVRSNPTQAGDYVAAELGSADLPHAADCYLGECSPSELVAWDRAEFNRRLRGAAERLDIGGVSRDAGGLANSRACITSEAGNVTVAIVWRGLVSMPNPAGADCGEAAGLYGEGNRYRRLLVLSTYVGAP